MHILVCTYVLVVYVLACTGYWLWMGWLLVEAHSVEEVLLNHFIDERLRRINAHVIALFAGPLHVEDDLGDQT